MKLQYKIALMIFVFGSLILLGVASLSYLYNRTLYISNLHLSLQEIARERGAHVEINLREKAGIAEALSNTPVLIDALIKSNVEFSSMTGKERRDEKVRLNERWIKTSDDSHPFIREYTDNRAALFLKDHMDRNRGVYGEIFLTNRTGFVVAATGKVSSLDHADKYWWLAAFAEGRGRIFFDDGGFDKGLSDHVTGVVVPVMREGKVIGILKCKVNINSFLQETVEGLKLGQTGRLRIVRSGGSVVLEKDKKPFSTELSPLIVEAIKKNGGHSLLVTEGGKTLLYAYAPVSLSSVTREYTFGSSVNSHDPPSENKGESWYTLVSQELDEALYPLHDRLIRDISVGLLTIVLIGLLSIFFGRRLALPVLTMERLAGRVGKGDFDVHLEVKSSDELGQLAESFNAMVQNLRDTTTSRNLLAKEVAERREAEEKLIKNENRFRELSLQFRTLLDAITDSLVLLSPDRQVIWSNNEGEESSGRKCYEVWNSTSSPCTDCPPLRSFEGGRPEESRISTDDGRVWDVRSFPIIGEEGEVRNVIELASDITEKVRLRGEMMRTGQLASVGELAAGVAHEINNPINGIINLAQLLTDESPPDDEHREIYDWIISEGNRIAVIVNELLTFARKNDSVNKPVKIDRIISKSLALTRAQMEKEGISIKVEISPDLPEIVANSGQLQQVVLNIINNARYALNEKYPGWHKNKILDIWAEKVNINEAPFMRIVFHDKGTGIAEDLRGKIINPFFSTKPEEEGTGLGLSISNGIILDHAGSLSFESVHGEYTTVTVDLPLMKNLEL